MEQEKDKTPKEEEKDQKENEAGQNEEKKSEKKEDQKSKTEASKNGEEEKKEEGKRSVTLLNSEVLNKYKVIINTSTSKQMYTFPREERFKNLSKKPIVEYYNLPSYLGTKGTFIGYGCKTDFTKGNKAGKSQAIYNIPREFDLSRSTGSPRYTFGVSRDNCKLPTNQTNAYPGPGNYSPYKPFGFEANKFSLYSRRNISNQKDKTPGPGSYSYMQINPNGRYALSSFQNSPKSLFGLDHSQRSGQRFNGYPGPGAYGVKTSIDGKGMVFDSAHISNPGKSMGQKLSLAGSNIVTPGPGSYNFFSDFEGFNKKV